MSRSLIYMGNREGGSYMSEQKTQFEYLIRTTLGLVDRPIAGPNIAFPVSHQIDPVLVMATVL